MPPIVCATGGGACQHNIEAVWGEVYGEEEESGETLASLSSVAFYDGVRDHLEDSTVAPASLVTLHSIESRGSSIDGKQADLAGKVRWNACGDGHHYALPSPMLAYPQAPVEAYAPAAGMRRMVRRTRGGRQWHSGRDTDLAIARALALNDRYRLQAINAFRGTCVLALRRENILVSLTVDSVIWSSRR
ncbi:hypothetical protein L1887_56405 [Cichorium endivia]|nr:hypothetical protein L1887_56405 [Cichorium endivia]